MLKLSMQTNTFEHSLAIKNKKRKHVKARLGFAEKKHNCNPVAMWEKTMWLDEAKTELFNQNSNQYV